MSYIGEARRKAEIEAKRAKLAELKRQRIEREQRLQQVTSAANSSWSSSRAETPTSRRDLDELVSSLVHANTLNRAQRSSIVGSDFSPASPGKSAAGGPASSEFGGSEAEAAGGASTNISGTTAVHRDGYPAIPAAPAAPAYAPELIDVETELFEFPQRERVYYTKEVQTADWAPDSDDAADGPSEAAGGVGSESRGDAKTTEEAIRAKILKEQAEEAASRREEERLEREIEEQLRELTDEERQAIYAAQDFSEFVEHSSKIVERALADSYDYMKDYTITADGLGHLHEGRQLRLVRTFGGGGDDKGLFANRSITDLDWSTQHPELCVASYNRNDMANDDPDGLVAVWNMHLKERPEFTFHAQTDVLSVRFSPFQPNLVIGGTYSGQILIWDTRARALPVLKTPLSAAGHTHPVYALNLVGTQNAHNLISASTDGNVCSWTLDMLASPQETMLLLNPNHQKTDEVGVTTMAFPEQETTHFWVGTEEGNVYAASRYDRASQRAGLNANEVYKGHSAPITGLHFHPLSGAVDFSDLFLTSSMDWTCKLWRVRGGNAVTKGTGAGAATPHSAGGAAGVTASGGSGTVGSLPSGGSGGSASLTTVGTGGLASGGVGGGAGAGAASGAAAAVDLEPLLSFEESSDYVYDVKWHPFHPAVFAQVDGSGRLDVYNLNVDTERPVQSTTIPSGRALNKCAWDKKEGRRIAVGSADGRVYVYDTAELFSSSSGGEEEVREFQNGLADLLKRRGAAAAVGGGGGSSLAGAVGMMAAAGAGVGGAMAELSVSGSLAGGGSGPMR